MEANMNRDISKMLTLSTRHVPVKELPAVAREAFADNEYCWLLYVGAPDTEDAPVLAHLVALAKRLGCEWLRLDEAGPVDPSLPSWTW